MLREIGTERLPHLRHVVTMDEEPHKGFHAWHELMADPAAVCLAEIDAALPPAGPNLHPVHERITGFPKGAVLTHHSILNNRYSAARTMALGPADRLCIPVPLYHCFGMVPGNLAALTGGCAMVYPSNAFDSVRVLEAIEAEGCTALHGVPTMFIAILNRPDLDTHDVSNLRTGIMAGSPYPTTTMQQVIGQLNMRDIIIGYGITETSLLTMQTAIDDPFEERVGTVGRIHPRADAKVVGPDGREPSTWINSPRQSRRYRG